MAHIFAQQGLSLNTYNKKIINLAQIKIKIRTLHACPWVENKVKKGSGTLFQKENCWQCPQQIVGLQLSQNG